MNIRNTRGAPESTWFDPFHHASDEAVTTGHGRPAELSGDRIFTFRLARNDARANKAA